MVEIINLRQKRKGKERAAKEKKAEENRLVYGQSKQEKELKKKEDANRKKFLDGHKREIEE